jgi:hypothetical protein
MLCALGCCWLDMVDTAALHARLRRQEICLHAPQLRGINRAVVAEVKAQPEAHHYFSTKVSESQGEKGGEHTTTCANRSYRLFEGA